jgi:hypothetical protein
LTARQPKRGGCFFYLRVSDWGLALGYQGINRIRTPGPSGSAKRL